MGVVRHQREPVCPSAIRWHRHDRPDSRTEHRLRPRDSVALLVADPTRLVHCWPRRCQSREGDGASVISRNAVVPETALSLRSSGARSSLGSTGQQKPARLIGKKNSPRPVHRCSRSDVTGTGSNSSTGWSVCSSTTPQHRALPITSNECCRLAIRLGQLPLSRRPRSRSSAQRGAGLPFQLVCEIPSAMSRTSSHSAACSGSSTAA